ncbi:hypothetical protein [Vitiosangium sp. GDMCC 1.1324]|uniref:hypothetical protein n=1 Tax=Vitiosangium sp. (strain GDMCC 1.1324) TaxID=2138576 RepID=UPI001E63B9AE|nr:hypothetical protein [Vitiosangium sp. GDMCC 1.1324]
MTAPNGMRAIVKHLGLPTRPARRAPGWVTRDAVASLRHQRPGLHTEHSEDSWR